MNQQYPIGKFVWPTQRKEVDLSVAVATLEQFPTLLQETVSSLSPEALAAPYREGGWSRLQVIHHLADSHLNAYVRLKWTLTESSPTIKAYDQDSWALLPDNQLSPDASMELIRGVHARMVSIYKSLNEEEWDRSFYHPENGRTIALWQLVALYAWHSMHHLEHLRSGQ